MAQFSNGSDPAADNFHLRQCAFCRLGETSCPIFLAQDQFNYKQNGNETAEAILTMLVRQDGICEMLEIAKKYLYFDANQQELEL